AVAALAAVGAGVAAWAQPLFERDADIGSWQLDSQQEALLFVPAGLAALAGTFLVLGPLGRLLRRVAVSLLEGTTEVVSPEAAVSVVFTAFFVGVWAAAGGGSFWPVWPALAFALIVAGHFAWTRWASGSRRIATLEATRAGAVDQQEAELRRIERDLHDGAQ